VTLKPQTPKQYVRLSMLSIDKTLLHLLLLLFAAAAAALPGKLTIRGNQVLEDGKPIRMHGINYFGREQLDSCC
jgi:hypothetical protein